MRQGGAPNGKLPRLGLPTGRVLGRVTLVMTGDELGLSDEPN